MKFYKKLQRFRGCVKRYVEANGIRCRYAGWVGMAADVDLVRIDGRIRKFDIRSNKETKDDG